MNNLAILYQQMGDFARAEPCTAGDSNHKAGPGLDHPDYAGSLSDLGTLYRKFGDYARAEPLFRQSMQITRDALGEQNPFYANSLNNLGEMYVETGSMPKRSLSCGRPCKLPVR